MCFSDWIGDIKSAAIIGKGASVFESKPLDLIKNCEFTCLMNSVDIDYLEPWIGNKFDAQLTTHVGRINSIIPVLNKEQIERTGIKILICNNTIDHNKGITVKDYWNYFNNRVQKIGYVPHSSEFNFKVDLSQYGERLSMASSLLMMLFNVKTLNKIVFVGVDAFHFGYSYRPGVSETDRHFYPFTEGGYDDPRTSHGLPFLKFLFETINLINSQRELIVLFPEVLRGHIDFPDENYIQFYE